jgi:taurine dioxygenase
MNTVRHDTSLDVRPLTGALGAEVRGLDVASLDKNGFTSVHALLMEYGAVALRGQAHLTIAQLREFGSRWGKLDIHGFAPFGGFADVLRVRADSDNPSVSDQWHTDASWKAMPPKITMLLAREIPSIGGDTMFSSQYRAYEALSDSMKAFIDPLDAGHDGRIINPKLAEQSEVHPVVITHPETHRKALYVNANYTQNILQLARRESESLLNFLFAHCTNESFQARVRYEPGTLAIWDQRCVQHAAAADFGEEVRELHRIAVVCEKRPSR